MQETRSDSTFTYTPIKFTLCSDSVRIARCRPLHPPSRVRQLHPEGREFRFSTRHSEAESWRIDATVPCAIAPTSPAWVRARQGAREVRRVERLGRRPGGHHVEVVDPSESRSSGN